MNRSLLLTFIISITFNLNIFCGQLVINKDCCNFLTKFLPIDCIDCSKLEENSCKIDGMVGKFDFRICELIKTVKKLKMNHDVHELINKIKKLKESCDNRSNPFDKQLKNNLFAKESSKLKYDLNYLLRVLLIHGEPGNGKTALAENIAKSMGAEFFKINSSSLVGQYSGEGPQKIIDIFENAKDHINQYGLPVVIFFDEIDSIAKARRGNSNSLQHNDTLMELCTRITDDLKSNPLLVVICATNLYSSLDEAFKNRFSDSRCIEIKKPSKEERRKIIEFYCSKHDDLKLDSNLLEELVNKSEHLSIREIELKINAALAYAENAPLNQYSIFLKREFDRKKSEIY